MKDNDTGSLIYLTTGAGGMFCGSCMHDNALAFALAGNGWDVRLVPMYTPIRTDESNYSVDQVYFGGINVYLQQKIPLFRYVPAVLDRFLDKPWLIRRVTSRSMEMDPKSLGQLALSMLKGSDGNQRKEVKRLCKFLKQNKRDVILFTNILVGGCIPEIKKQIDVPVLVTLQGDDVFLDSLEEPFRKRCIEQIKRVAKSVDGFIVHSQFFRNYMSNYFELDPAQIHVTPLGLDMSDFTSLLDREINHTGQTIGYLARLAPEKGFHLLVDAFLELKKDPTNKDVKLQVAGWLGPDQKEYAESNFARIREAGMEDDFVYLGSIDRQAKLKMLEDINLLCVPTVFQEPKGLYALEALAAGVPVLLPDHGTFPEFVEQSAGGVLFKAHDTTDLAQKLTDLIHNPNQLSKLGTAGRNYVHQHRNAQVMSANTAAVLRNYIDRR